MKNDFEDKQDFFSEDPVPEDPDFEMEEVDEEEESDAPADDEYSEADFEDVSEDDGTDDEGGSDDEEDAKPKKKRLGLKIGLGFLGVVVLFACFMLFTKPGRNIGYKWIGKFVHNNVGTKVDEEEPEQFVAPVIDEEEPEGGSVVVNEDGTVNIISKEGEIITDDGEPRHEDYVKTYLIFGLEEIDGASNSDAMMLVSLNTKDNTIKLVSLLRDTYVDIPGWNPNKLNSAYARGAHGATTSQEAKTNGAALLVKTIEDNFDVDITGYCCVNFKSFEKVVDRLGGIDIELGSKEASYLCSTNYISEPSNRNVSAGWNHLNGNQVVGYCRVRKVVTLGGANNDYGRTVRQRRVIKAIIEKYMSSSITDLLPIMRDCLGYVSTNLTEEQITEAVALVLENRLSISESLRLPADDLFYDSGLEGIYNGSKNILYALVMGEHKQDNIDKLHEFLFLDGQDSGEAATE